MSEERPSIEDIIYLWIDQYPKRWIPFDSRPQAFKDLVSHFVKYEYTRDDIGFGVQRKILDLLLRNTPGRKVTEQIDTDSLKIAIVAHYSRPKGFNEELPEEKYAEEAVHYAEELRNKRNPEDVVPPLDLSKVNPDHVTDAVMATDEELDKELGISNE